MADRSRLRFDVSTRWWWMDPAQWRGVKCHTRLDRLYAFAFTEWIRAAACVESHAQPSLDDVIARLELPPRAR